MPDRTVEAPQSGDGQGAATDSPDREAGSGASKGGDQCPPDPVPNPSGTEDDAQEPIFPPEEIDVGEVMRAYTVAELQEIGFKREWLIKGFWILGSYGQLAGMEKALKTWIGVMIAVSVASGEKLFGQFEVRQRGPVLIFTGEVDKESYNLKLRHAAKSLGIGDEAFAQLPIHVIDKRALTRHPRFQSTLKHHLNEIRPVLVLLDPLYSYHGADVEAGNLHASTEVLNAISDPCVKARASLIVVNHYRKMGDGKLSLTDITQAGGREWVESWILVKHRGDVDDDDVARGRFELELRVGSRSGNSARFGLDVDIGPMDEETLLYRGKMGTEVKGPSRSKGPGPRARIITFLAEHPDETFSKTAIHEAVGGRKGDIFKLLTKLADDWAAPVKRVGEEFAYDPSAGVENSG